MLKVFDFYCEECKSVEEHLIDSIDTIINCSKCGGDMRCLPSAPPFLLKGKCWAKDNYSYNGGSNAQQ